MKTLKIGNASPNFHSSYCPPPSDYVDTKLMGAPARDFVVPSGAYKVFFKIYPEGTPFWMDAYKTAVIPTGDIANGSAPEYNPAGRAVKPGDTLSVITNVTGAIIHAIYYE
jgi:hypothetical protein